MAQVTDKENEAAGIIIKLAQGIPSEIKVHNWQISEAIFPECLQKIELGNKPFIRKNLSFFRRTHNFRYVKGILDKVEKTAFGKGYYETKFTRQNLLDLLPEINNKFERDQIDNCLIEQFKLIFSINRFSYTLANTINLIKWKPVKINQVTTQEHDAAETMLELAQGVHSEIPDLIATNWQIAEALFPKFLQKIELRNKDYTRNNLYFFSCIHNYIEIKNILDKVEKIAFGKGYCETKFTRQNLLNLIPEIKNKFERNEIDSCFIEQFKLIFSINRYAYSLANTIHYLKSKEFINTNDLFLFNKEKSKKRKLN